MLPQGNVPTRLFERQKGDSMKTNAIKQPVSQNQKTKFTTTFLITLILLLLPLNASAQWANRANDPLYKDKIITFKDGDPADVDEINHNFNTLDSKIDTKAEAIGLDVEGLNIKNSEANPAFELIVNGYIVGPTTSEFFGSNSEPLSAEVNSNWEGNTKLDAAGATYYVWLFRLSNGTSTLKYSDQQYKPKNPPYLAEGEEETGIKTIWRKRLGKVTNDASSNFSTISIEGESDLVPRGMIAAFNGSSCPSGWDIADGTDDPSTDGGTNSMDLKGRFLRGMAGSVEDRDPDGNRAVGSYQNEAYKAHGHAYSGTVANSGGHNHGIGSSRTATNRDSGGYNVAGGYPRHSSVDIMSHGSGDHSHTYSGASNSSGGSETRPKNVTVLYCIKQ